MPRVTCEHCTPAVDGHGRSIDEARIIREQVHDGGGNLLGAGDPAEWMQQAHLLFDPRDSLRLLSAKECLVALGDHRARRYGIDANAMWPVLDRQGACQPFNGCLGGRVRRSAGNCLPCLVGREVDDRPRRSGRQETANRGRAPDDDRVEV